MTRRTPRQTIQQTTRTRKFGVCVRRVAIHSTATLTINRAAISPASVALKLVIDPPGTIPNNAADRPD
jgi:hypothetical protein